MNGKGSTIEKVVLLNKIVKFLGSTLERHPIQADFTYDSNGNLTEILIKDLVTERQKKITITYDSNGNLTQIKEEVVGV